MEFLKGYKLKFLGIAWAVAAAVDGLGGINILASVDATNWLDNVMIGFGVFAGRDTIDTIIDKLKGEFNR